MKEFAVILEKDSTGFYVADVPELSGCHTQGKTKEDALKNIKEAIELYLSVVKDKKMHSKQTFVGVEKVCANV